MTEPISHRGPDLRALFALFPPSDDLPGHTIVPGSAVPPPYHGLLVHEHHMTVTVEVYHGGPVGVRVLEEARDGDSYARKILLVHHDTGKIVQFGIVRIHLQYCSPDVRTEILAGQRPLGHVLIRHNVFRRIEPTAFVRVDADPIVARWFQIAEPAQTYGRLAYIHCDDKPAIELLEIVSPVNL